MGTIVKVKVRPTPHERRRGYRPEGTRPNLPTLAAAKGWPGANPPRWLCPRWAANSE